MTNEHALFGRRDFLAGAALAAGLTTALTTSASAAPAPAATTPDEALALLKAGNTRFVAGKPTCVNLANRRAELVGGQSPFAIIVSCSDSRVPVETVFDQEPGHVFGVRVAGNFVDPAGLGSIEYAVAVLKSPLILVLGHYECGAVKAAMDYVQSGKTFPGHIQLLAETIAPAAKKSKSRSGDWFHNAIAQNVRDTVASLPSRSTIVSDAVSSDKLRIVGAVYNLSTGKVRLL
jgi:carbonic anhydrase